MNGSNSFKLMWNVCRNTDNSEGFSNFIRRLRFQLNEKKQTLGNTLIMTIIFSILIVIIANVRVSCVAVWHVGRSPLGSSHSSLLTSRALCANICPPGWSTEDFSSPARSISLHQTSDLEDMTLRYIARLIVGLVVLTFKSKSKFNLCMTVWLNSRRESLQQKWWDAFIVHEKWMRTLYMCASVCSL